MEIYEKLWQQILGELQSIYTQETYDDYFGNLNEIYKYQNNHIYIIVENEWTKRRINDVHLMKINSLAKNITRSQLILFLSLIQVRFWTSITKARIFIWR